MPEMMDPILPLLVHLGYWAILLGILDRKVLDFVDTRTRHWRVGQLLGLDKEVAKQRLELPKIKDPNIDPKKVELLCSLFWNIGPKSGASCWESM